MHDDYLFVGPGADESSLRHALASAEPGIDVTVFLDEPDEVINPGHPTMIAYHGHIDADTLAARLRELLAWDVRSEREMAELAGRRQRAAS